MDVRIDTERAAQAALGTIFGEDVTKGPVFKAPPVLAQFLADWPAHRDDFVEVGLDPPPLCPVVNFPVRFHRIDIVGEGKFMGYALRMDAANLETLNAWAAAWSNHRRLHAH